MAGVSVERPDMTPRVISGGSTSGIDTLADLASMQQPQLQQQRVLQPGTKAMASVMRPGAVPTTSKPNSFNADMHMRDTPPVQPKAFAAASLAETDLQNIADLVKYLVDNPYAYQSHIQLINLLHRGFIAHVTPGEDDPPKDPHTYELLPDLRQAREAMKDRYAVGVDIWVDWIEDETMLATDLAQCIEVMELCTKARDEEQGSTRLNLLYGNWITTLYKMARSDTTAWPEEDKLMAQEAFGWAEVVTVWKQAVADTQWRLNDSNLVWDAYITTLLEEHALSPTKVKIEEIQDLFVNRLRTPHGTWDQTFGMFSTFVTQHDDPANYEDTMKKTMKLASEAKAKYAAREQYEFNVNKATQSGDKDAEWIAYNEYLEFETGQNRRKLDIGLCRALFERVLIRQGTDPSLWEDYVFFILERADIGPHAIAVLPVLQRATRHCPWSGSLWAQYLLSAEKNFKPIEELEQIKHNATTKGLLDIGGVEEVLKMYTQWCGFLKRRAFVEDSSEDDQMVAEFGIRAALESMSEFSQKKTAGGKVWVDPTFRLERIYIQFLSKGGKWIDARDIWKSLVSVHGDSYDFWLKYYHWEMICWGKLTEGQVLTEQSQGKSTPAPSHATSVLLDAVRRPKLDWPERICEIFLQHCEDHENVEELQDAVVVIRKARKGIAKRRETEALEAAELAQPNGDVTMADAAAVPNGKRKREIEGADSNATKKTKQEDPMSGPTDQTLDPSSLLKRDRENTTVIVKKLPANTTETKVRQYFRDCGTINSLNLLVEKDGHSSTATIEFESKEDVLSAQTRDMKTFDGESIEVQIGSGSTVWVSNYPPTADEAYIRNLFKDVSSLIPSCKFPANDEQCGEIIDIRFPSLKYNTHRRFCYVQFKTAVGAEAATKLSGKSLGEKETLIARISAPNRKQGRSGPIYEEREIFISNLAFTAKEEDLRTVFGEFGTIEQIRVPKRIDGKMKGIAFIVYATSDAAKAALEVHLKEIKGRAVNVVMSEADASKRLGLGSGVIHKDGSVAGDQSMNGDADSAMGSPAPSHGSSTHPDKAALQASIKARTLALMDVPDTINGPRLQAIFKPFGPLKKVQLKPDHGGAIIEFEAEADAAKARLATDGQELAPGKPIKIAIGGYGELMREGKPDRKTTKFSGKGGGASAKAGLGFAGPTRVQRPAQAGARGGRGGLGIKRVTAGMGGGPIASGANAVKSDGDVKMEDAGAAAPLQTNGAADKGPAAEKKTQADFKALMGIGGAKKDEE
jgi:squamous cell carcinoma antigen recognized by T-cells 3